MKIRWVNALILAAICIVVALALGLTNIVTAPRIELTAELASESARLSLFPEADGFVRQEVAEDAGIDSCYAAMRGDELLGYTAQVTVSGAQGYMELTTGMDTDGSIVGLVVGGKNFKETPGLGSKVKDEAFTAQFVSLALPAALNDNVDGITSATISSAACVAGVNKAGYYLQEVLDPVDDTALAEDLVFGGLLPGATVSAEQAAPEGVDALWSSDAGCVVYVSEPGRNGDVQVQVGVANNGSVVSVRINEETLKETAGLGDVITERYFWGQFLGQAGPFTVGGNIDGVSGATISSWAVVNAVNRAVEAATPFLDPEGPSYVTTVDLSGETETGDAVKGADFVTAQAVRTGSGVQVISAADWAGAYPEIYASYMLSAQTSGITDYVEKYPMISVLYEGMAFNTYYGSARGHYYTIADVTETGRPHALANCFTCKTPDFTAMVNELGDAAYSLAFEDVLAQVNEPVSCYNCHANTPGEIVITHSYLSDAMGADLTEVDGGTLACAQCHVEYYFNPATKATRLPYTSLATMDPDDILAYFNATMVEGQPFADYTNPRTGVRQIKVQHPEFETFMGEGSVHAADFSCADCHMGTGVTAAGEEYRSHYLQSPLENEALLRNTCSQCHEDLAAQVAEIQAEAERRTYAIGYELEYLTEALVQAIDSGAYTEAELDAVRALARDAQFYWDFVFVENSEGAHNSALTAQCLDKAEALFNEAMALLKK